LLKQFAPENKAFLLKVGSNSDTHCLAGGHVPRFNALQPIVISADFVIPSAKERYIIEFLWK
jgi:hypothetical protein